VPDYKNKHKKSDGFSSIAFYFDELGKLQLESDLVLDNRALHFTKMAYMSSRKSNTYSLAFFA